MSSGKIVALARSVCAGLLESLGITSGGAYTPPSGGGIVKAIGMSGHPVLTTTSTSVISCDCSIPTSLVGEGGDVVEKTVSGSLNTATTGVGGLAASKTNSTRYYIYMIYNSTTDSVELIGLTISSRITPAASIDIFTQLPSGYDYYREIGEFYVDSSGDIVPFMRNGNRVKFGDYTDHALYTAANLATSFANASYPAAAPALAESVLLIASSDYNANQAMRVIFASDNTGTNATSAEGYMLVSWGAYKGNYLNVRCEYVPDDPDLSGGLWHRSTATTSVNNASLYLAEYTWSV